MKTTDKVKNDHILKQFPALISKTSIYYDNLSDHQRINLKENYKSSGKLINHLGSDENNYLSFEMYKLSLKLGCDIEIKKILEYYHSDFMKNYIDFLYDKKTEYKRLGDKSMMLTYKILMNSLYGSMLTRVENFRDFKIITNSKQADFYTKRSNFDSRVIINEDLTIVEMNKIKCVYNSPILIGSVILQNSKVLLFDYIYNKFPRLFGKENMKIGYVDTDSIIFKIENMKKTEYQNIQKNNPDIFGYKIGLMEVEIDKNHEITEYIGLSSKWGEFNPIFAHGKMCVFPFFPMGKSGEKSIWKEREMNTFPFLSIYFFPHFSHGEKWEKTHFSMGKNGVDPPVSVIRI